MGIRVVLGMCVALLFGARGVEAAPFVIDFEGLQNLEFPLDYYSGGTGHLGSTGGPNYGVVFDDVAFVAIDLDAGGSGRFENEPSPSTAFGFTTHTPADLIGSTVINVAGGFDTGFSFFYSSSSLDGFAQIYDGTDGTGALLAQIDLAPNSSTAACPADPFEPFICWDAAGAAFAGIARSIVITGPVQRMVFDNLTFGSADPIVNSVPEPATWLLLGSGVAGVAARMRRRRA